jgi:hypothetical protein
MGGVNTGQGIREGTGVWRESKYHTHTHTQDSLIKPSKYCLKTGKEGGLMQYNKRGKVVHCCMYGNTTMKLPSTINAH